VKWSNITLDSKTNGHVRSSCLISNRADSVHVFSYRSPRRAHGDAGSANQSDILQYTFNNKDRATNLSCLDSHRLPMLL